EAPPNGPFDLEHSAFSRGVVARHRNGFKNTPAIAARIELHGNGSGFSRLDLFVPSPRRGATAGRPHVADFKPLVTRVGEHEIMFDHRPRIHLPEIEIEIGELNSGAGGGW